MLPVTANYKIAMECLDGILADKLGFHILEPIAKIG